MTRRWVKHGWPLVLLLAAPLALHWIRGPQPERAAATPADTSRADDLLSAVDAFLSGSDRRRSVDVGDETWFVTGYPPSGGQPVTVRVTAAPLADWAGPLRRVWPGRLQVDRAIDDPPGPRAGPWGLGLDVGLDGWIEDDGRVHLPVHFLIAGFSRPRLAAFFDAEPGQPLRTFAWVPTPDGPKRMLRHSIDPGPCSPELLRRRCDLAGDYLSRHLRPHNMFDYEWHAVRGQPLPGYNLLRHAGTTYSLFQLYRRTGRQSHYRTAMRALGYLKTKRAFAAGDRSRCFLVAEQRKIKLGGAGLALVALVEQARARPFDADRQWMHCLAEHIISQTEPSGYMHSFYTDGGRFPFSEHRSAYYPGEALLGLVRLHRLEPNPRYMECAIRAADFLIHRRWRALGLELMVPPDAWLAQALQELFALSGQRAYAEYTFRIGRVMTRAQAVADGLPEDLVGARIGTGLPNVVSAGSRGEALAAAAKLERDLHPDQAFFLRRLKANTRVALRNQYTDPILFGMRRAEQALGGFRSAPDHPVIRIDGVQHNLSALIGLLDLLEEPP